MNIPLVFKIGSLLVVGLPLIALIFFQIIDVDVSGEIEPRKLFQDVVFAFRRMFLVAVRS